MATSTIYWKLTKLHQALQSDDAVAVGAGAGLSTAAGFTYSGEPFQKHIADFIGKYGFTDMYTAGFYNFPTEEEHRSYWSRHIYHNRYVPALKPVYENLLNLRFNETFVEDEGWHAASQRYTDFLTRHKNGRVLFLDLGSGGNTPIIFKIPFIKMTMQNPRATYATVNLGEAFTVEQIADRSIVIDADIGEVVEKLRMMNRWVLM